MDWVGVFAKVSKSARASSGEAVVARLLTAVRIGFASVLGSPRQCRERRSRRGRGPPSATCARATSGDRAERSVRRRCRVVMRRQEPGRAGRANLRGRPWGHPSPLCVDPTRVHVSSRDSCGPGTFENAPQDPCCVGGVSYALDYESRGRSGSQRQTEAPSYRDPVPPLSGTTGTPHRVCHAVDGFQPLRYGPAVSHTR